MAYLPPYTVLAAQEGACAEFQKTADLANIYLGYFFPGVAKFWALQLVELKKMGNF